LKHLTRHSGARAKPAIPESIIPIRGYGFLHSPLTRLGRNDEVRGLRPRIPHHCRNWLTVAGRDVSSRARNFLMAANVGASTPPGRSIKTMA
jgi:hypothetical protein